MFILLSLIIGVISIYSNVFFTILNYYSYFLYTKLINNYNYLIDISNVLHYYIVNKSLLLI